MIERVFGHAESHNRRDQASGARHVRDRAGGVANVSDLGVRRARTRYAGESLAGGARSPARPLMIPMSENEVSDPAAERQRYFGAVGAGRSAAAQRSARMTAAERWCDDQVAPRREMVREVKRISPSRASIAGSRRCSAERRMPSCIAWNLPCGRFFRRCKRRETAGFPRSKPSTRRKQLMFPHGDRALTIVGGRVNVPGVGRVRLRRGRNLESDPVQEPRYG